MSLLPTGKSAGAGAAGPHTTVPWRQKYSKHQIGAPSPVLGWEGQRPYHRPGKPLPREEEESLWGRRPGSAPWFDWLPLREGCVQWLPGPPLRAEAGSSWELPGAPQLPQHLSASESLMCTARISFFKKIIETTSLKSTCFFPPALLSPVTEDGLREDPFQSLRRWSALGDNQVRTQEQLPSKNQSRRIWKASLALKSYTLFYDASFLDLFISRLWRDVALHPNPETLALLRAGHWSTRNIRTAGQGSQSCPAAGWAGKREGYKRGPCPTLDVIFESHSFVSAPLCLSFHVWVKTGVGLAHRFPSAAPSWCQSSRL